MLGQHVIGIPEPGPCPALTEQGCGLVLTPEIYDPVRHHRYGKERMQSSAKLLIGAGVACDAQDEDEDLDSNKREAMLQYAMSIPIEQIEKAKEAWGI